MTINIERLFTSLAMGSDHVEVEAVQLGEKQKLTMKVQNADKRQSAHVDFNQPYSNDYTRAIRAMSEMNKGGGNK